MWSDKEELNWRSTTNSKLENINKMRRKKFNKILSPVCECWLGGWHEKLQTASGQKCDANWWTENSQVGSGSHENFDSNTLLHLNVPDVLQADLKCHYWWWRRYKYVIQTDVPVLSTTPTTSQNRYLSVSNKLAI